MKRVMGKIVVAGAGGQGSSCASILARDKDVSEVVLADINIELASKVKSRIQSDKIKVAKIDAGKADDLERVIKGADAVINLTLPRFNMNIMRAALRSGAHYVDTAFCDSAVPFEVQLIKHEPLELDVEFKEAGLTALIGCGATPGVTNVMVRYVCDKLDRVHEIFIRCSGKISKKPKDIISAWDPGWSPETAIRDWLEEPVVFENGEFKRCSPFSGREEYNFDPHGTVLLCYHEHEEPLTLPRFIDKGVKYVDFKYPLDIQIGSLIRLGLASDKAVDVKGVKVVPRDLLVSLARPPINTFFTEEETIKLPVDSVKIMEIKVRGVKSGESVEYTISYPYTPLLTSLGERLEMYKRFGTTNIYVAMPAIVGAKMCVEGDAGNGVVSPECLEPIKFLRKMSNMGAPLKFRETLLKEVAIT